MEGAERGWRRLTTRRGGARRTRLLVALAGVLAACGGGTLPPSDAAGSASAPDPTAPSTVGSGEIAAAGGAAEEAGVDVLIALDEGRTIDRRLFGTNVPAWLGADTLTDETFQAETLASGTTLIRMPGGSWSNAYDWKGCELGDESTCFWTWAARPTDFIDFLQATSLPGMWTASINATAQSAAASVAFFNGSVGDERLIGPDRDGVDWGSVGDWAQLRADGGNPEPVDIGLWEVGNEVYGGKPEAGGAECAGFGWEDVWTCDGNEYVLGDGDHDGYLAIRAAMIEVDPEIEVGAVGVSQPGEWSNWGNEVIEQTGDDLDFYVVHDYGFDRSPSATEAARRPGDLWPMMVEEVSKVLPTGVPIAVTEYNLVTFGDGDTEQAMTRVLNAVFIADSIGRLALGGVEIANQWNLANGRTESGTDYGMIDLENESRHPQFEALASWSRVGETLHGVDVDDDDLRVYPTTHEDGRWTILVLNMSAEPVTKSFAIADPDVSSSADVRSSWADDPNQLQFEQSTSSLTVDAGAFDVELRPWSITTIDIEHDA